MKMDVKKGESEGTIVTIRGYGIPIPDALLEELGWYYGDKLNMVPAEIYFDWGEVTGLVLRNISMEKRELTTD